MSNNALEAIRSAMESWNPSGAVGDIPCGDMPGDSVQIGPEHIRKADVIFPALLPILRDVLLASEHRRAVIAVFGGSGVGKSEIASLLAHYLREIGVGAYTLSGDNYPRRIPMYNDAERLRIFRAYGVRGMLEDGVYSPETRRVLDGLWAEETDPDPAMTQKYPWLASYQKHGRAALASYLGTEQEQDYDELSAITDQFKSGAGKIWLKRMGRTDTALWYDEVDLSGVDVLVIEWTHGGSGKYRGVDIPILLGSTPAETREHRRARARDSKTDSAFTTMVLEIEQRLIEERAPAAKLIVSKAGELLSLEAYQSAMDTGR